MITLKDLQKQIDYLKARCCCSDVLNFDTFGDFPLVGVVDKFYVDLENNTIYIWNGSGYVALGGSTPEAKAVVQADMLSNANQSYQLPHIVDTYTEIIDNKNAFDPVTGIFTCQKTGNYLINISLYGSGASGNLNLYKNGVNYLYIYKDVMYINSIASRFFSLRKVLALNVGDTIYLLMDSADYVYGSESITGLVTFPGYINIIEL